MRPVIFAHRGASGQFAEHTRAAYLQAIADGADGVECDVRLSRDRELICLHDPTLDRTSNGSGNVADSTLAQLRRLDFSSWKGTAIPPEFGGVPDQLLTLADLTGILRGAGRKIALAIECKGPSCRGLEDAVLEVLRSEGWEPETSRLDNITVSFMSFSPETVLRLLNDVPKRFVCQLLAGPEAAGADPDTGRLQGRAGVLELIRAHRVGLAGPGIGYVQAHPREVARLLDGGMRLRVWTVDSPQEFELCRRLGIQEITTNRPAEAAAYFAGVPGHSAAGPAVVE